MSRFETCPHCGKQVMKGAMRCIGCGKILKTAEQQQASIERHKESKEKSFFGKFLKFLFFILFLIAASIIYRNYSDQIMTLINSLLKK